MKTPGAVRRNTQLGTPTAIMRRFLAQPGFLLARIDQICSALHAQHARGETLAQAEFLLLLAHDATSDQVSLARALGVDTSTTAIILDNLVTRGLIARRPDPQDRRRALLSLTGPGKRQLRAVRAAYLQVHTALLEALPSAAAPTLLSALRHIGANPLSPAPRWIPEDRVAGIGSNDVTPAAPFLARRALQVFHAYFIQSAAAMNLTPRQFSVLFIIKRHPQLSQVGFARMFGLDPATSAFIMKKLDARGLLRREVASTDRRQRLYSLTPAGERTLLAAQPLVDKSERLAMHGLSSSQLAALVQQLQQIVRAHTHCLPFPGACFPV